MTILRKIKGEPGHALLLLSCGHATGIAPANPAHGWAHCSSCAYERIHAAGKQRAAGARTTARAR